MTIPGRVGIVLRDPLPWEQSLQVVETAEETGYEAVFLPEISAREAFSTLAGFAGSTSTIKLGTGVVTVGSRSAPTMAMAAATVHELSGGRMILGLGSGDPVGRTPYRDRGLSAVEVVRRVTTTVRRILRGEEVEPDEELGSPGFGLTLPFDGEPPPVWLGALGDRMVSLAGEVADGVLLNWCTPARVAEARRSVDRARAAGGRTSEPFTVAVYVRACLGVAEATALDSLKAMAAQYAAYPHYRRQMDAMGLGEQAAVAAKAFEAGRPQGVPDELVRTLTVMGGRTEALDRFEQYFRAGADLVLCYPVTVLEPFSSVLRTLLAAAPAPAVER